MHDGLEISTTMVYVLVLGTQVTAVSFPDGTENLNVGFLRDKFSRAREPTHFSSDRVAGHGETEARNRTPANERRNGLDSH